MRVTMSCMELCALIRAACCMLAQLRLVGWGVTRWSMLAERPANRPGTKPRRASQPPGRLFLVVLLCCTSPALATATPDLLQPRRGSVSGGSGVERRRSSIGNINMERRSSLPDLGNFNTQGGRRSSVSIEAGGSLGPGARWSSTRHVMKQIKAVLGDAAMEARVRRLEKEHQGVNEYYQREALRERMQHRRCESVCESLERWWDVPQNSFIDSEGNRCTSLSCGQYMTVLRKVGRALVTDDEYDPEEVEQAAREDWEKDSHGLEQMSREMFQDAIFECVRCARERATCRRRARDVAPLPRAEFTELRRTSLARRRLVDTWTEGTNAEDYVKFLDQLLNDVATGDPTPCPPNTKCMPSHSAPHGHG
jgi:hypothetical protein